MTWEGRFIEARLRVMCDRERDGGIGTLGEKTLHRIVKTMMEPDAARHEVKLCGSVVDILSKDDIVIEVQTRDLYRLLPKLRRLLESYRVIVVHPIAKTKTLRWIDPKTGEITPARKSPKSGAPRDAVRELYGMREVIAHENLTVQLLFVDVEEYRTLDGWSRDRKRGSTRAERIPVAYRSHETLSSDEDYVRLYLPPNVGDQPFTVAEYAKRMKMKERYAYYAICLLVKRGILVHNGNRGRAFLYETTEKCKEFVT